MKYFIVLTILLQTTIFAYSQISVTGIVLDKETRQNLEFALIRISGANKTVSTDKYGGFELRLPGAITTDSSVSLTVSYIGYIGKQILVYNPHQPLVIELERGTVNLAEVTIRPQSNENSFHTISKIDLNLQPVRSAQDILRTVPGLFIGQHQGGGKAEQIFLRGFDIDHGTDINVTVDGMPVNMVSHAHGQGYADLHFLIPELTNSVDYGKGPYYSSHGNLGTAGYVGLSTLNSLDKSTIKLEAGQFNTIRTLAMIDLLPKRLKEKGTNAYIASEFLYSDGPFKSPQHFNRFNIFGKLNTKVFRKTKLEFSASTLSSDWDASGQVPERAIKSGSIDRFGYIDSSEGGYTSRTNLNLQLFSKLKNSAEWRNQVYYSRYNFNLHSNFTFFLNDPVNGDQIRQKEGRNIYGFLSTFSKRYSLKNSEWHSTYGTGFRYDQTQNSELSNTINRNTVLSYRQLGDIDEFNGFFYTNQSIETGNWLFDIGSRFDFFHFSYFDQLQNRELPTRNKQIISPKLSVQYTFSERMQLYTKLGRGFHSNDSRLIVSNTGKEILPAAYGGDIGVNLKPFKGLFINAAAWYLYLEQEFVYVGDEGIVEASGKTRRIGIDLSARYQLNKWLFADLNVNIAKPRSIDEAKGEDYIPLAPTLTSTGGISWQMKNGINGSLRYRHLNDRTANETKTVIAKGYTIADLQINYTKKRYEFGISIENLFNTKWNETQFETESRLKNETDPVSEIHFTPGTPFFARAKLAIFF